MGKAYHTNWDGISHQLGWHFTPIGMAHVQSKDNMFSQRTLFSQKAYLVNRPSKTERPSKPESGVSSKIGGPPKGPSKLKTQNRGVSSKIGGLQRTFQTRIGGVFQNRGSSKKDLPNSRHRIGGVFQNRGSPKGPSKKDLPKSGVSYPRIGGLQRTFQN